MQPDEVIEAELPALSVESRSKTAVRAADTPVGPRLVHARWNDLWIAGDATALRPPLVAMVGTRRPDLHGRRMAWDICTGLVHAGVCVVSGGALGIDATVHSAAIEAGGRTVVVMPSGFSKCYPARHAALFSRVLDTGGALVSPFHPDTPPARWTFPKRNALLAALCDLLVVVQAPADSGSLITAEAARDLGRRLFVVPSVPGDPRSEGCLRLLRTGAEICTSADDVLHALSGDGGPLFERNTRRSAPRAKKGTSQTGSHGTPEETSAGEKEIRTSNRRGAATRTNPNSRSNTRARAHAGDESVGRRSDEPVRSAADTAASWSLDAETTVVYESLTQGALHVDEIALRTSLSVSRVRTSVITLVLVGIVLDVGNGTFRRA